MLAQLLHKRRNSGFTLIELLVVIGILAVLLAIVLVAINPAKQFSQSNDTKRSSDVNAILNAIHQYAADNKGAITTLGIGTTSTAISSTGTGEAFCTALVSEYLAALPTDPTGPESGVPIEPADCAGAWDTGYTVIRSTDNNRVTVSATGEITTTIEVTR